MIAYWFPPDGSAGVYRPLRFVRKLPAMGWSPVVLAADLHPNGWSRYDPGLLSLIPADMEIVRVHSRDWWQAIQAKRARRIQKDWITRTETTRRSNSKNPNAFRSWLRDLIRTAESWCYHPDKESGWISPGFQAALKLCKHKTIDVLWATAGPVSSFVIARKLSRQTGIPYVLDFRDAWTITFNEFEARRPNWARRLDQKRMFSLLKGAQAVIFRYETEAECFWRAYPGAVESSSIHIIPNGYEGSIDEFTSPAGECCKVLYTGTISDYRYDTLLEALQRFKQAKPNLAQRLQLHFVGEGGEALESKVAGFGLTELVTISAPTSYGKVQELYAQAHALLLLGRPPTMPGFELFAAAKLFGYLKAGRPILGVLPHDEARKILDRVGVSTVASVDSVPEIVALLRKVVEGWAQGRLSSLIPDPHACRMFSAERQTEDLVCALNGNPPDHLFVPGRAEIPASLKDEIRRRERNRLGLPRRSQEELLLRSQI